MTGDNCSARCRTKDHATFGECMRAKSLSIAYCNSAAGKDFTAQKNLDTTLDRYEAARAEGIQPAGTTTQAVNAAMAASDAHGKAFDAS